MSSQYVWVGIAVGVFAAGIAIGYGVFSATYQPTPMMNQQMMQQNPQIMDQWNQQMMSSQAGRQQMMTMMMQNQAFMQSMMDDPQFREQMLQNMRENHDFAQAMIMSMMDDPAIRTQMMGHMLENEEFMREFQEVMGQGSGMEMQ